MLILGGIETKIYPINTNMHHCEPRICVTLLRRDCKEKKFEKIKRKLRGNYLPPPTTPQTKK